MSDTMVKVPLSDDSFMERHAAVYAVWSITNMIKHAHQISKRAAEAADKAREFEVAAADLSLALAA
jgi:hypothetical protein